MHPWLLLIIYSIHKTATDRRWERFYSSTSSTKKLAPLTTQPKTIRCISAAEHNTRKQYSITSRTKPWKYFTSKDWSWNTRQNYFKILILWEAALETEQRCFSKVIFESDATPKILISTDSSKTGPPRVHWATGNALCVHVLSCP